MTAPHGQTRDRLRTALFGIATRRAVRDYLVMVLLIMFILLMIAMTIDLAANFASLRLSAAEDGTPVAGLMARYMTYRTVDIVTRLLPMATFFGVFLAEIYRRNRLESIILSTSGASPSRLLAAVFWVGLLLGALQAVNEAKWRPWAVFAQVDLEQGDYARWYARGWMKKASWFVSGETAIRAEVLRSDAPELRDVLVFHGIRQRELSAIYAAQRAVPTGTPYKWRLEGVSQWRSAFDSPPAAPGGVVTLTLDLVPEQLTYLHVQEFNLPGAALSALSPLSDIPNAAKIQVAVARRWSVWLLPGAFALLATCLAQAGFTGRTLMIPRLIALGAVGFLLVTSIKVFWALGELAVVPAAAAVSVPAAFALGLSAVLILRRS